MAEKTLLDRMAAVYAAYNDGDAEPLFGLFAEDGIIRFAASPEIYPFAAPRQGPNGAREAVALILEDFEWLTYRNFELIAEGDHVFALNGGRIRHRASGREAVIHLADLIRFENGQVVEFIEFFDSAGIHDWFAGLGLPACSLLNPGNKAVVSDPEEPARNKSALSEAYVAYGRKDADPFLQLLAEDACYNSVAGLQDFDFAGPCYGRDAFAENLSRIATDYELVKYQVLTMVAQDDLVAVHADVAFRDRQTGGLASTEKIDLFRLRNGQILEFNEFFDTFASRAALKAG